MRRSLRTNWAARALFLLAVLGFTVGWASACVHPQSLQFAGAYEQAAPTAPLPGHSHHAPGDIDALDCDPASKAPVELCDSQQRTTPKTEAPRLLDGAARPAAIHALAAAWVVDRVAPAGPLQTRTSPPVVSVAIRFLRLTL